MKRTLVLLAVAAIALPSTAFAKGPASATIDGPGTGGGITLSGDGEQGYTALGKLTEYAGFFPAMFRQTPDPMRDDPPPGNLGPKYTVTYTLPDPNGGTRPEKVTQEVYPYANPPVTYTKPGQTFYETEGTRGGWFVSTPVLRETLIEAGLSPTPPAGSSTDDGAAVSTGTLLAIAAAMALLLLASALFLRRRTRPAAAA
jgi:hypothetical protein